MIFLRLNSNFVWTKYLKAKMHLVVIVACDFVTTEKNVCNSLLNCKQSNWIEFSTLFAKFNKNKWSKNVQHFCNKNMLMNWWRMTNSARILTWHLVLYDFLFLSWAYHHFLIVCILSFVIFVYQTSFLVFWRCFLLVWRCQCWHVCSGIKN